MEKNMTQVLELVAEARENVGKGSARAARRNEQIPAVIYGGKAAPATINLNYKDMTKYIGKRSFFTSVFNLKVGNKTHSVLPRDIQYHPVSDRALHIDFLRVTKSTKVRVNIPLNYTNLDKSPGLKRGGTLNVVTQDVEVLCSATNIPSMFEIDLDGYVLGQPVHLGAIDLPKGVEHANKNLETTIASIAVPSALRSKAREEARSGEEGEEGSAEEGAEDAKPAEEAAK